MVPLYFLKSNGQLGGRVILGRSSKGSLIKVFFGTTRFLYTLIAQSRSELVGPHLGEEF